MAGWATHTFIADRLLAGGLPLDRRGFVVGSIAPDCNVENADWSDFDPPREKTHFMTGKSKTTADYEAFYRAYIRNCTFRSPEHEAFLWGYYTHLVTDVMFSRFLHDEVRCAACLNRLKADGRYTAHLSETDAADGFAVIKQAVGREALNADTAYLEGMYLASHPDNSYTAVLRRIESFPDYLDFLPPGAIVRKIGIMAVDMRLSEIAKTDMLIFSGDEYRRFMDDVCAYVMPRVYDRITENFIALP